MILAISFMESWRKFQAPTLTREVGLDVGRLIFFTLNRMEILGKFDQTIAFLLYSHGLNVACCFMLFMFHGFEQVQDIIDYKGLYVLVLILAVQVLILQPQLDERGRAIARGAKLPPSKIHTAYVLLECAKLGCFLRLAYHFLTML